MPKKFIYSIEEKEKIFELFNNGAILSEIGKFFKCSYGTIGKVLIGLLGIEQYKEIAKEHLRESYRKIGKKTGPENARKLGLIYGKRSKKNEKNPNWKGGISKLEFETLYGMTPEEWQKLAQSIRKRDYFICQYCGRRRSTSVHHIVPKRVKIDNHPNNLITLCRKCHPKIEKLTEKYIRERKDPIEIFYEKWNFDKNAKKNKG